MSDGALTAGRPAKRQPLLRLLSDERLAKLACEGSTPAFAAIYERHHQLVYRYSRSILHSDHDARDALQNTMLKAMQALAGESREIELRPWLLRIAHNESVSMLRQRPPDAPIDGADELAAVETDPEARNRLRSLIADLDQLSHRQRSALVMRELNGLEFKEIGRALETSPEGAKQAVYEARLSLHELEEGREMSCDEVRRKISAEDRRLLRGRRVRGHLRSCEGCRAFEGSTRARRSQLACLAPPLPAPLALGILESLIGGGSWGGGIGALAGGGAAAGLTGSTAAKLGVAGVLALGIGAVALETGNSGTASGAASGAETGQPHRSSVGDSSRGGDRARGSHGEARGTREKHDRGEGRGNGRSDDRRRPGGAPGGSGAGAGIHAESNLGPPGSAGIQAPPDAVGPPPSGGDGAPSDSPQGGGQAPLPDSPPAVGGGGRGPAGLPPGHGGLPPGLGGTPPGLGVPPPGHADTPPGLGETPPGRGP